MRDSLHYFLALLLLISPILVKSDTRRIYYDEVPASFEQYQDSAGFIWQVDKSGALSSGKTQYLPSGLKLHINNSAFRPQKAELIDDRATGGPMDLIVTGAVGDFGVARQFWFDLDRSAVRVVDVISNNGAESLKIDLALKSSFQFPWQNLVGTSGDILGSNNPIKLNESDHGLATKFSIAEGRQDTLFLCCIDPGNPTSPTVEASANARELSLNYSVTLNPGERRVLVHWVVRRNIGKLDEFPTVTNQFIDRGAMINPRVSPSLLASVSNFPASAFVKQIQDGPNVKQLVILNRYLEKRSIKRSEKDTLYIGANNYLEGSVNPAASVLFDKLGTVELWKIAAIEGGGGSGRVPRVFLRDGQVLAGDATAKEFTFKIGNTWMEDPIDIASLDFILFASQSSDGSLPSQTQAMIELRDGNVIAAKSIAPIEMATVWGTREVALENIKELHYQSLPTPEFRLHQRDGSILGVFPGQKALLVETVAGESIEINPRLILRVSKGGATNNNASTPANTWSELSDVPEPWQLSEGFLLYGNNLVSGSFVELPTLSLVDGAAQIKVSTAEIKSIKRLSDQQSPQFEITLQNGNSLKGDLIQSTIRIGSKESRLEIPIRHLIAYTNKQKEGDK